MRSTIGLQRMAKLYASLTNHVLPVDTGYGLRGPLPVKGLNASGQVGQPPNRIDQLLS